MSVIILSVCSLEDVAQGVNVTAGRIKVFSELGCDVYGNAIEILSSETTAYEDIILLDIGVYKRYHF